MRYTGIQPQYFPRLHYFARILNADVFVLRDDCQFVRKHKYPDGKIGTSYQAHTPIKQTKGPHLLAVPTTQDTLVSIAKTPISYQNKWAQNHWVTIKYIYKSASFYGALFPQIQTLISQPYTYLGELSTRSLLWAILILLGEETPPQEHLTLAYVNTKLQQQTHFRLKKIYNATDLSCAKTFDTLHANEKILAIIKELGATEDYCGGTAMAAYMDEDIFQKAQITVTVQNWQCPAYTQQFHSHPFTPNLSIIDLLLNESLETCRNVLSSTD